MIEENEVEFEFNVDGIEDVTFVVDEMTGGEVEQTDTTEENKEGSELTFMAPSPGEILEEGNEVVFTEDKPSDNSVPSSPSFIADFASALAKDGVITGIEEEKLKGITSLLALKDAIADTIKSNEFADLDDRAKEVLNAIRAGVPVEKIEKFHNTEMQLAQYTEDRFVDDEDDDEEALTYKAEVRRNLIFNDYRVKGFTEEVAKRKTDASFKSGDDVEDAKIAIESLRSKINENKKAEFQAAQANKQKYEEARESLKQNVLKTEEIVPGLKVSEEMRRQLAEAMTVPTGRTKEGQLRTVVSDKRAENPSAFDTKLNYYIALGLFNDKPDLSIFTKAKVSSAVSEMEKNLTSSGVYEGGRGINLENVMKTEQRNLDLSLLDNIKF
jgi:hypothetical protein